MCLAIPGKVVRWMNRDPLQARAVILFGELEKECHLACVPEAEVGDYVIVHAGVAISKVDPIEAEKILEEMDQQEVALELENRSDRGGV